MRTVSSPRKPPTIPVLLGLQVTVSVYRVQGARLKPYSLHLLFPKGPGTSGCKGFYTVPSGLISACTTADSKNPA